MAAGDGGSGGSRGENGVPARRVDLAAYGALGAMILIGSTTAPAAKLAVAEIPLGLIPLARFGLAGLILLPIVWREPGFRRMFREDWKRLAITAACCIPINQAFFLAGAKLAPTTHIALIYAAVPLVVLILASSLGQERLTPGRIFGVASSMLGLAVIALGNLGARGPEGPGVALGDGLLILAVIAWGSYLTVGKPLVARYGSLSVLAGTFLVGALLDLPIAAWSSRALTLADLASVQPRAWLALAYLIVGISIFALFFQNVALRRLDASQVATFGNVSPPLTMIWGHLLFGDRLTPTLALGGSLILLGLFGSARSARKPARLATPTLATIKARPEPVPASA